MSCYTISCSAVNTLGPRDFWRENADDSFKRNFFNENVRILKNISLGIVAHDLNDKLSVLVYKMDWRRQGARPFSKAKLTNVCDTRPQ